MTSEEHSFWTGQDLSDAEVYHRREACPRLTCTTPETQSQSTVEWHDLDPCQWCHETIEAPSGVANSVSAKAIQQFSAGDPPGVDDPLPNPRRRSIDAE